MNFRRLCAAIVLSLLAAGAAMGQQTAAEWVTKARSFLGTEAALNSVKSLHFEGSFEGTERVPDPEHAGQTVERPVSVSIDIVFQSPMQHRQTLRSEKVERTTALDGYDGWEKVVDRAPAGTTRLALLDGASIKRLRAAAIENLSFYGDRDGSRRIQLLGDATVDGVSCVKVEFRHSDSIVFVRYFDRANGRLVKTEIEGGAEIREEGEMIVSGVRFPKKVINRATSGRVTVITFDKITVNESFPDLVFRVPPFLNK